MKTYFLNINLKLSISSKPRINYTTKIMKAPSELKTHLLEIINQKKKMPPQYILLPKYIEHVLLLCSIFELRKHILL